VVRPFLFRPQRLLSVSNGQNDGHDHSSDCFSRLCLTVVWQGQVSSIGYSVARRLTSQMNSSS
jgi:hypothetical protein